jgi:hypothetical protein
MPPPDEEDDERVKRLKQASRLIVTSREKMPHSARWHLSLRRTLWRYTQEVLLRKRGRQPDDMEKMEEKTGDQRSRSAY